MNLYEAKDILDQVRRGEGSGIGQNVIHLALRLTGDVGSSQAVRSQGVDQEIPAQDWRARCRERAIMVGRSKE